jgi:hypothetical protein
VQVGESSLVLRDWQDTTPPRTFHHDAPARFTERRRLRCTQTT